MATDERNPSRRAVETETDPPPRRWGRALLWLALIVVLVAGAVAVSVAFDEDDQPGSELAIAPLDIDQFCTTAAEFRNFDRLDLTGDAAERLNGLSLAATQLASLSPPTVADDLDMVATAFANVADVVQSVPADDPNRLAVVLQRLDDELGGVEAQANHAADYINQWCGPPGTTQPAPTSTEPAPTSTEPAPTSTQPG